MSRFKVEMWGGNNGVFLEEMFWSMIHEEGPDTFWFQLGFLACGLFEGFFGKAFGFSLAFTTHTQWSNTPSPCFRTN